MHHGFPLQAVCGEFASHWDPGLAVMGFFLITQRTSNALCVMWDQKSHAGEVVLKTNNHLLEKENFYWMISDNLVLLFLS